eukprot:scpid40910/ scgid4521/ Tyrosine-protein kinase transmembrane receptor Ror
MGPSFRCQERLGFVVVACLLIILTQWSGCTLASTSKPSSLGITTAATSNSSSDDVVSSSKAVDISTIPNGLVKTTDVVADMRPDMATRLALVLGSVGGTLLLILIVFAAVKLVQRQRVNYLRSSKRGDIERRGLTGRRSSVSDSISSGYSSDGPVTNARRVPRRSYATLSEFAMGSFYSSSGDVQGMSNPGFMPEMDLPNTIAHVDRDQIALFKKLREINYGKVHQAEVCELLEDELTTTVTAKIISDAPTARHREDFYAELKILAECKHDNIIRLMCICVSRDPHMFCVEHMELGNLRDFLLQAATCSATDDGTKSDVIDLDLVGGGMSMLSDGDLALIGAQIAAGMAYLTEKGFVHKDLAARSCEVSAGLHVRISEFGFARDLTSGDYYATGANKDVLLPVRWTAPEAIMFGQYSIASSIWSFGITLWEVYSLGARPYGEMEDSEVIKALTKFQLPSQPSSWPEEIGTLIAACLDKMSKQRPPFTELQSRLESFYQGHHDLATTYSAISLTVGMEKMQARLPPVSVI